MDLDDLKTKLFGAAEAVIMGMDRQEKSGEVSPSLKLMPSRYRAFAKKNRFRTSPWGAPSRNLSGSFCSLSSFGSSNELTELQEDAKCRRISSEIFRHRLYETVLCRGPARRRCLSVAIGEEEDKDVDLYPVRYVQSVPTTPIYSSSTSPIQSPKSTRRALLGLPKANRSRNSSKNNLAADKDGEKYKGLACILQRDSSTDSDDLNSIGDLDLDSDLDIDLHIEEDVDLHITEEGDPADPVNLKSREISPSKPRRNQPRTISNSDKKSHDASDDKMSGLKKRCKGVVTRDMLQDCMYS